jgi:hypothetical protein
LSRAAAARGGRKGSMPVTGRNRARQHASNRLKPSGLGAMAGPVRQKMKRKSKSWLDCKGLTDRKQLWAAKEK